MNTKYEYNNESGMEDLPVDSQSLVKDFKFYLHYHLGRFFGCNPIYCYEALSFTVRDRIMNNWCKTWKRHSQPGTRKAFYMSLEFLIGRAMGNHLLNLDLKDASGKAMQDLSLNLEDVMAQEHDAGLGNGGLGRLAACFMDSCATLELPVIGYGLRYEYGMFKQKIVNGYQIEEPDHWLRDGNPWELERPEHTQTIQFGGYTEEYRDANGNKRYRWVGTADVLAIPYDMPISGYRNNTVNTLRLWSASATSEFCLEDFNAGDYTEAVEAKNDAEHITMVLYPNDASENGKKLRLRQQYFLASASLKDAMRLWEAAGNSDYNNFARDNVFQMNDTHPTIAVAELMRILTDEKGLKWNDAWRITTECMAYTNHTLLPEALEKWPVPMFGELLPRLLEIIYKINVWFLEQVTERWPGDVDRMARMSIIEEGHVKHVRMAYLAVVASFSVNGVAELHSKLLCRGLFQDFCDLWPEKFNNKTNGVTPRRWIAYANPALTKLISEYISNDWIADLSKINGLSRYAMPEHQDFHQKWDQVKQLNKKRLAKMVKERCGVEFDVNAMFDVQV
ncbi:MAG: glycogen/starch/alpha-glucan family phosphorylase, partial [Gammaproteobacteria bacterium]|nr:glycogen/starch/alpha-glucan family phosphorylase [Gammaproteobacteria bacterium]